MRGAEAHGWSARNKFAAVIETAAMNESERSEYCCKRGLYPEQLAAWRRACRKLPRQGDTSKVEFRARFAYCSGLRSPSESWGQVSL